MDSLRHLLVDLYAAGLTAVEGSQAVYHALQARGKREPCHVVAIGKAADAMLQGAQRYLHTNLCSALLITKHGHVTSLAGKDRVQVIEAAHPVPDESSLQAGQTLITYLQHLPDNEPVLFLISGGTSSLVEVLADDWTLERLQETTQAMLANGSTISEINTMRRSLSRIKGGKLWHYLGERPVSCLLMSDVPGDDPAVIGSGLLFPSPREDFDWQIIASNQQMLTAMVEQSILPPSFEKGGVGGGFSSEIFLMPDFLTGNAETIAHQCIEHLRNSKPGIYLWGAETTVQLPPYPGRGGRNQHLALAAALQLRPDDPILLLAAGTDGTDGMSEDAGALVDGDTVERGKCENLDPVACLQAADAGTFLDASGDLLHTGPTGTNVMDVIIGLKL